MSQGGEEESSKGVEMRKELVKEEGNEKRRTELEENERRRRERIKKNKIGEEERDEKSISAG